MELKARKRIEHYDNDAAEMRISNPGEACDYLPEEKAALYLQLGIVERVGGEPEPEPEPSPVLPDSGDAAGADSEDEESREPADEGGVEEIDLDEILSATVGEIAAEIVAGDHDGYLTELEDAESERRTRKGVLDAIAKRQAEIESDDEE